MQHNHRQRPQRRDRVRKALAGGLAVSFVVGGLAVLGTASASTGWSATRLSNGGFDSGIKGWTAHYSGSTLTRVASAHAGTHAARITASKAGVDLMLNDVPNVVSRAPKGRQYLAEVWVRSSSSAPITLRVREWKNGSVVTVKSASTSGASGWKKLSVQLTTRAAKGSLALNVFSRNAREGRTLDVDGISIQSRAAAGTAAPVGTVTGPVTGSSSGSTLFGESMWQRSGETWPQTFNRLEGVYGRIDFVRAFLGAPRADWSGYLSVGPRPMNVSFKALPKEILSGRYDATLRTWFRTAPTDRPVWWTYYHEPENDIQRGAFNAADYRAAWKHVVAIADANAPKNLKATLVLMDWSANPKSGRDWRDYYAGTTYIDAFGWDSYNSHGGNPTRYWDPAENFGLTVQVSKAAGKPFGFSEWGSTLVPGDSGSGRAAWMKACARYFESVGAEFVAWFDTPVKNEYRLFDKPSQNALRDIMAGNF